MLALPLKKKQPDVQIDESLITFFRQSLHLIESSTVQKW